MYQYMSYILGVTKNIDHLYFLFNISGTGKHIATGLYRYAIPQIEKKVVKSS